MINTSSFVLFSAAASSSVSTVYFNCPTPIDFYQPGQINGNSWSAFEDNQHALQIASDKQAEYIAIGKRLFRDAMAGASTGWYANNQGQKETTTHFQMLKFKYARKQMGSPYPYSLNMPFHDQLYHFITPQGEPFTITDTDLMMCAYQAAERHARKVEHVGPFDLYQDAEKASQLYAGLSDPYSILIRGMENLVIYASEASKSTAVAQGASREDMHMNDHVHPMAVKEMENFFRMVDKRHHVKQSDGVSIHFAQQVTDLVSLIVRDSYRDYFKKNPLDLSGEKEEIMENQSSTRKNLILFNGFLEVLLVFSVSARILSCAKEAVIGNAPKNNDQADTQNNKRNKRK